jgi:hypothetical protein
MPTFRQRLQYRLESFSVHDTIDPAATWHGQLGAFDARLHRHRLQAVIDSPIHEAALARQRLEAILRDWETVALLTDGHELRFVYEGVAVGEPNGQWADLDRTGAEPGVLPVVDAIVRRHRPDYPPPDPAFRISPMVLSMLREIEAFRADVPTLPLVAQRILGILADSFDGDGESLSHGDHLRGAAQRLSIDDEVVTQLAGLSARATEAATPPGQIRYRGAEWQWMQEALTRLTLQAGRAGQGAPGTRLSMDAFVARL